VFEPIDTHWDELQAKSISGLVMSGHEVVEVAAGAVGRRHVPFEAAVDNAFAA
jgi:hypothetical protein